MTVAVDDLRAATSSVRVTFDGVPPDPVPVAGTGEVAPEAFDEIVDRYDRHGFAIMQLASGPFDRDAVLALGLSLGLGEPFVPPLYTMGDSDAAAVSRISAAANAGTGDGDHPSFGRTVGQRFHCDGTLQDIGFVKASVLLCESVAEAGGETILFNSSAAYAELMAVDPAAAVALATPGALIRQANIGGCTDTHVGPAFTVQDGQLACGYSVTDTDRWATPAGVAEDDLRRSVEFLLRASMPGSRFHLERRLAAQQAIVFDNTRISHGRLAYRDSPDRHRCVYRGLFLQRPTRPVGAARRSPAAVARTSPPPSDDAVAATDG
ncbi:TauD/TfdA family dioxygenase, partial [Micromonospora sp. DH15]|nr:TauD/TfdA family dioxygenase [Micromonospora sp. DH15]